MDSLLFLIESKISSLPVSERKIADYILKKQKSVIHLNVRKLASETNTSSAAVMRLCKTLGIPGFQEMKIMLARDVYSTNTNNISKMTYPEDLFPQNKNTHEKIIYSNIEGLLDLKTSIDTELIKKTVDYIEESTFLYSFGIGLSNSVAFDFYHKMNRLGRVCGFTHDTQMQIIGASNLQKGMVAFIISHSGMTEEMVNVAKIAKENGARVISITSSTTGALTDYCDITLLVPFSEPIKRFGASSTRIVQLTIIDILFTELVYRNPSESMDKLSKHI